MPTKAEKDAITGTETTGHEWDGIRELNTPLPKWWLYVFYVTIAWSLLYVILYPAIPWLGGHTAGILGYDQRLQLQGALEEARNERQVAMAGLEQASLEEIRGDPELLTFALAGGEASFADNCAACHGLGGAGQHGYPTLADDVWLWGGTLEAIHTTLLYGVRHDHPQSRFSLMPSFGVDGLLDGGEIEAVADHVLFLSGQGDGSEAGAALFAEQCAACHGEQGEGLELLGAPALSDAVWLYGGTRPQIIAQIHDPKHGVMPGWADRLDPSTIKMLAVYVHALGGGR